MRLIGDTISRQELILVAETSTEELSSLRDSFVLTKEAHRLIERFVAALIAPQEPTPRPIMLTGECGTGKTHLIRFLECLLTTPQDPRWRKSGISVPDLKNLRRSFKSRYLSVPERAEIDLGDFLLANIPAPRNRGGSACVPGQVSIAEFDARIAKCLADTFSGSNGLLVIDGMSRRLSHFADEVRIRREVELIRLLVEAGPQHRVTPVVIADEEPVRSGPGSPASAVFAELRSLGEVFRVTPRQIEEVIVSTLAAKDSAQRAEILKTVEYLSERLPRLAADPEAFIDLYPLHPQAFNILFPLRAVLSRLSPLGFAHAAIDSASSRSCAHLITHETLFDFALSDLRSAPGCIPYMKSFDALNTTAISHLKPALQSKARALLKAIALETICAEKSASVRSLANALLLYDDGQPLPGYSLAAAILLEMEDRGGGFLEGDGNGFERTYRLLCRQPHTVLSPHPGHGLNGEDLRPRVTKMIYDWFHAQIPAWKLNPDPKYLRMSLSFAAPIPEGPDRSAGLVHFKSVQDPFWSAYDLQSLQDSKHSWVFLVLNPFEHFYEFENQITNIAGASPKMLVWRPDSPTSEEIERLRRLAAEQPWPPTTGEGPGKPAQAAAHEADLILDAIYCKRGKLLTCRGASVPTAEIGDRALSQYLSHRLASISDHSLATVIFDEADAAEGATQTQYDAGSGALDWAAALSGEDDLREMDLQSAEERLLAWWVSTQEIDASALAARLSPLPDILMTTRFWGEYRQFVRHLDLLRQTFQLLRTRSICLREAMSRVRLQFNRDEDVLRRWKTLNLELAGLARWIPALEHMSEYLRGAFETPLEEVNKLRAGLLCAIARPHEFLKAGNRDRFDHEFLSFKRQYIDCYDSLHEAEMQLGADGPSIKIRVDSGALHNLELLSKLQHADKSYVSRIQVIARWFQNNQCTLPVRGILERSPRCFCGFNPGAESNMHSAAKRVNGLIEQGLGYFCGSLVKCRDLVIEELKRMHVDEISSRQIASLLGEGEMLPLTSHSIDVLNQVIARHPRPFMAALLPRKS